MKLVLLDRDGTINDTQEHVLHPDQFMLIDGAAAAIARLNQAGFKVVVVTNQSSIGRGWMSEEILNHIHQKMIDELHQHGAFVDDILFAPDPPHDPTHRRKPGAGMLIEAMQKFSAQPDQTIMVGDSIVDLKAGHKAGCHKYLVRTGKGKKTEQKPEMDQVQPVQIFDHLPQVVEQILKDHA